MLQTLHSIFLPVYNTDYTADQSNTSFCYKPCCHYSYLCIILIYCYWLNCLYTAIVTNTAVNMPTSVKYLYWLYCLSLQHKLLLQTLHSIFLPLYNTHTDYTVCHSNTIYCFKHCNQHSYLCIIMILIILLVTPTQAIVTHTTVNVLTCV